MRNALSLRVVLTISILMLTSIVVLGWVAIRNVDDALIDATGLLADSAESIRISEEAEVSLLLHPLAKDSTTRSRRRREVTAFLYDASRFVGTPAEQEVLDEAAAAADRYFADEGRTTEMLRDAAAALDRFAEINVEQAREAKTVTERRSARARSLANLTIVLFVAVAGLTVLWLWIFALRPTESLSRAMQRFMAGDRGARADEIGPVELREMAAGFNRMASILAKQRDSQAAFLAGVAHDLRIPLSTLRLSVDVASPQRPLPDEEGIRKILARVHRQVAALERMVQDFLDIARVEAGELEVNVEPHDLRERVRAAVDLFEDKADDHKLTIELPDEPVPVRCDPLRIDQVLNNLVSNAIKYSPDGGDVTVVVERRSDKGCVSVKDQGIGIPRDLQREIFEPFRRVTIGHKISGVGLGLFVSRRIVEAHGGELTVRSAPGHGSTFTVTLPLSDAPSLPPARGKLSLNPPAPTLGLSAGVAGVSSSKLTQSASTRSPSSSPSRHDRRQLRRAATHRVVPGRDGPGHRAPLPDRLRLPRRPEPARARPPRS